MAILTPEALAASGTEDGTHRAILQSLMQNWRNEYNELALMYHVPNGGSRGDSRNAAIAGAKLAALGVKKGVPDLCLPIRRLKWNNLYIEVKAPNKKGKLSPEQKEFLSLLALNGSLVAIVDDWRMGVDIVVAYLRSDFAILQMINGYYTQNPAILDPSGYFG